MQYPSNLMIEASAAPIPETTIHRERHIDVQSLHVTPVLSRKLDRPQGYYTTLTPTRQAQPSDVARVLANHITTMLRQVDVTRGDLLVVGLGNDDYVVDALGTQVIQRIQPNPDRALRLCTLLPRVQGVSGIASHDVIRGVVHTGKPRAVVAIDTLTTRDAARLGSCYQLTTAGIRPGSGVANPQPPLDHATLRVPVLAIGVPLLISVGAMCNCATLARDTALTMVTPRNIDELVRHCAVAIADALEQVSLRSGNA